MRRFVESRLDCLTEAGSLVRRGRWRRKVIVRPLLNGSLNPPPLETEKPNPT
jgi:hypothetical protein